MKRRRRKKTFYKDVVKRILDVCLSSTALVLLMPLMLVIALLVKQKLGSPILFYQKRPGKDGKIFRLYKFRTMTEERDKNGKLLPDEKRLTEFGKFLRSTSLDELPSLLCVLAGKMSLIGPRPLLVSYLPLYNKKQRRRHEVLPGLTGYAQVHGRNSLTWQEKFDLDVYYVDHISFWLDLKIFFQTIYHVLKRDGISAEGSATMEAFKGNKAEREK